jgi:basic membrane protein A and related proteins
MSSPVTWTPQGSVIETAEARGVKTCGHAFDQAPLAPKGYITGAEYNWTELFETFIETLQRGGTLPNFVTGGYDKDYVRSSPFGAGATPEAINAAKTAMVAMRNGDAIFVGPISDNTGKQVVPAGTTYGPYADELQQTNYLIEGIIGSITWLNKKPIQLMEFDGSGGGTRTPDTRIMIPLL